MKKTPTIWIIDELKEKGSVSRNDSLNKRVTNRLGAYIHDLVDMGYKFDSHKSKKGDCIYHGKMVKTRFGSDYIYTLVSFPKKVKKL